MKTLALLLSTAALTACAATPPPPPPPFVDERVAAGPGYDAAEARASAEADVRAAFGETAWREIAAAPSAIVVRQGVSLPRMIQQPDGSWEPEGPRVNAAIRTAQGWIGWPGGVRSLLSPETGRELDRLLTIPSLWSEPAFPGGSCTDWAGLTSVIRHRGREQINTHVCGAAGVSGQIAQIVLGSRIVDWAAVPPANLPAGITLMRFPEQIEQYFRYSSALHDPANLVVTTPVEWEGIWRRLVARQGNPPPQPAVDFSREMLLVAAMGGQPSGGYAIHIDRVLNNETFLEVLVTRTSPGPRCGATAAITNPVDIVRAPISMKPVRWSVRDVETVCP